MIVYLAARYSRREELCRYRAELQNVGIEVKARWLDGKHDLTDEQAGRTDDEAIALRGSFASEDIRDLLECNTIVCFTELPGVAKPGRGGRHVEFGIALGLHLTTIIVGPRENVFHCLPFRNIHQFKEWPEALSFLESKNVK